MPQNIMTSFVHSVTRTDIISQIQQLKESMDQVELTPDGYSSDDEDSDNEHLGENKHANTTHVLKATHGQTKKASNPMLNNKNFDKRFPLKLFKGHDSPRHVHISAKSTLFSRNEHKHHTYHDKKGEHHDKHIHHLKEASIDETRTETKTDNDGSNAQQEAYTEETLRPIMSGQCQKDEHVPIMSPPVQEEPPKLGFSIDSRSFSSYAMYAKALSYRFLLVGERIPCSFEVEKSTKETKTLLDNSVPVNCFCSSANTSNDSFGGWEISQPVNKPKGDKRRKLSLKPTSEPTFSRLTQTLGKDPVIFHHYKDRSKYIERYRFYHTVGNVGRPASYHRYSETPPENDTYYSRTTSNLRDTVSPVTFPSDLLPSQLREKRAGSASSNDSAREKQRPEVDDDSTETSASSPTKHYSVRDRGKALNLAPVRECTVPNMKETGKIDIVQLNKYLNLATPPNVNGVLQFEFEDGFVKKVGNRVANTGDNNLFPACSPRRGARPLRLGSAEFMKPGTADSETTTRAIQRSATFSGGPPPPGNLIVGSTVTSSIQKPRVKSGSKSNKVSAYIQFQKDLLQHKYNLTRPQTPPKQVSGQKFFPCDRVSELSSAPKERSGKFSFTNSGFDGSRSPLSVDTGKLIDIQESYRAREREKKLTLDVNHLGIRGTTFKQSEELVLYKNRRAAVIRM